MTLKGIFLLIVVGMLICISNVSSDDNCSAVLCDSIKDYKMSKSSEDVVFCCDVKDYKSP